MIKALSREGLRVNESGELEPEVCAGRDFPTSEFAV